mgnify:CR=1 FL=1
MKKSSKTPGKGTLKKDKEQINKSLENKDYEKAKECNRLAGIEKPDSEQVLYNNRYFEELEKQNEEKFSEENQKNT